MGRQPESPFLTVREVAALLRVSPARAYAMAADGVYPTSRLGGRRIVVPRAAFDAWLRDREVEALANVRSSGS